HEVYWVNTIGTRRPRLNLATLSRGVQKLRHWLHSANGSTALPSNLHVFNPQMWPWLSTRFDRWLNRQLLTRQLGKHLQALPVAPIGITTVPIVVDFMDLLPVSRWVYYCVDDFSQWPGLDQQSLTTMEERLLA